MKARSSLAVLAPRRGRPRKFAGPSRALTVTLPEDVIAALESVDPDLSRAIVRIAAASVKTSPSPAELSTFGRRAVIVVHPSPTLEKHTGVFLVPLPDGRALIAFDESTTPTRLELLIRDALEEEGLSPHDARVFNGIAGVLRDARRSPDVSVQQRSIIVIESRRRRSHEVTKSTKSHEVARSRESGPRSRSR